MSTKEKILEILKQNFLIQHIEIEDDSHLHAGHAQAQKFGGGHFSVMIVSDNFEGKKIIERHRMIYDVLNAELKSSVHALAIKALTSDEYETLGS